MYTIATLTEANIAVGDAVQLPHDLRQHVPYVLLYHIRRSDNSNPSDVYPTGFRFDTAFTPMAFNSARDVVRSAATVSGDGTECQFNQTKTGKSRAAFTYDGYSTNRCQIGILRFQLEGNAMRVIDTYAPVPGAFCRTDSVFTRNSANRERVGFVAESAAAIVNAVLLSPIPHAAGQAKTPVYNGGTLVPFGKFQYIQTASTGPFPTGATAYTYGGGPYLYMQDSNGASKNYTAAQARTAQLASALTTWKTAANSGTVLTYASYTNPRPTYASANALALYNEIPLTAGVRNTVENYLSSCGSETLAFCDPSGKPSMLCMGMANLKPGAMAGNQAIMAREFAAFSGSHSLVASGATHYIVHIDNPLNGALDGTNKRMVFTP